jgi:hypothetical protein
MIRHGGGEFVRALWQRNKANSVAFDLKEHAINAFCSLNDIIYLSHFLYATIT